MMKLKPIYQNYRMPCSAYFKPSMSTAIKVTTMFNLMRTFTIAALMGSTMTLAACDGGPAASSNSGERTQYEVAGDHAIGNVDAAVTIVEYASVTCASCANWHDAVWPELRKKYVDSGKVRFVYREFPAPANTARLAETGFMIARCADEDKYFTNLSVQYKRQKALLSAAQNSQARQAYRDLARVAGLSEDEFEACLANDEEYGAMKAVIKGGYERGVNVTPTFFINGEKVKAFTIDQFEAELETRGVEIDKEDSQTP